MSARSVLTILVAAVLLLTAGSAAARPLSAPASTVFTYQGRLTEGGSPATGDYDFEFGLYDASSGGTQFGSTIPLGSVAVLDGLFTVELDFGEVFDGTPLWLQIGVAPGGSGGPYTPLDPRQRLSPTPYAIFAGTAASAPWGGLTGVPLGFADGVDDEGAGTSYQNLVVVAKSGGDFTTITAALNSITASDSSRYLIYVAPGVYSEQVTMEPYVDIQGSGELNTKITFTGSALDNTGTLLGADNAELRFLTVENTGGDTNAVAIYNDGVAPRLTHVTASASGATNSYGVYNTFSSPTMADVTASASGPWTATGVYNYSSSPTMTDVTASASGGTYSYGVSNVGGLPSMTNVTASASDGTSGNYGVYNDESSPTMTNVTAGASGGANSYGVYSNLGSPTMTNVTASASGASSNYGVYNSYSSPTMTDVSASASDGSSAVGVYNASSSPTMTDVSASASGGTDNYGVYNDSSSPTMTNVTAGASGGSSNNYGVYNDSSSPTMTNLTAGASGSTNNYGVYAGASAVLVNNSHISGSTYTIWSDGASTTGVGASLLSGGPVLNGGSLTCAGVYDENYIFYASTCP